MKRVKTDKQIIKLLNTTGHLQFPFGRFEDVAFTADLSSLSHPHVAQAIRSFQEYMLPELEPLCLKHHSHSARCDGKLGPATYDLFDLHRCGCPDYGPEVQPAIGKGSWAGCHGIGKFHAATVYIDTQGMPSFLKPVFEEVWAQNVAAYEAIGLRWIRTEDESKANIKFSFVNRSRGWIGLAVVGHGQSCGSQIWCQYLATYRPADIVRMWIALIMHELGHNAGLDHTRIGIMAPVLSSGLKPTWRGDASEPILKRLYGGVAIDSTPKPPEPPLPPQPPFIDDGTVFGIATFYRWNKKLQRNVPVHAWDMTPRPIVPEEVKT